MSTQSPTDTTAIDELEARHERDTNDDFDELGPQKACYFLTCLIGSDAN